ncbi:hypothetical protein KUTeg_012165 [Tegillarca granosa]|uniref:DDE Tnp4 domain-containing protein n=1 Tax=Tegillarca granosa TaxID=220873 RepID=A0ABQ9F2A5_TEGGR|nr:hypothetical protein KUTeg_012165 [Tegillarca granosa]
MADKLTVKGNKIAGVLSIYQMVENVVELDLESQPTDDIYPLLSLTATDMDIQRDTRPKIEGFVERVVPKMTVSGFRRHFRVAPDVYRHLLDKFLYDLTKVQHGGYAQVSVEKQFLVFLWYVANQDSQREIALIFGIGEWAVNNIVRNLIVDDTLIINNAYTGWPGSVHDARVLRNSQFYDDAAQRKNVSRGNYILADAAYPLKRWIMTPYKDNGHLTPQQKKVQ